MEQVTRADVLDILRAHGVAADIAALYADAWIEYREASTNIQTHGAIVAHPRTGNPIPNPYLDVRDRARAALHRMRSSATAAAWTLLEQSPPDTQPM